MRTLQTVAGETAAGDVNLICVHEHLLLDMSHEALEPEEDKERFYGDIRIADLGRLRRNPYEMRTNLVLDSVEDAVRELSYLKEYGCDLLVDVTSVGLGRDAEGLRQISRQSGIRIVAGCGLFVHDSRVEDYASFSEEKIADWMLAEIEHGIGDTGIRPGVIGEIGTSARIEALEERSLHAAAAASERTGLPMYIHTYPWSRAGLDAVDLVLSHGVDASKICLCHLDVTFDDAYIAQALARGVYVEFDNLGKEFYFPAQEGSFAGGPFETDVARAGKLKQLTDQGFADRLLLANDLCLKASLHRYGGWGYDHLFANFIPMMRMEGVPEDAIQTMVYENPKRFLFS